MIDWRAALRVLLTFLVALVFWSLFSRPGTRRGGRAARRVTWRLFARKDVGEARQREQVAKLLAGAAETEPNADP